MYFLKLYFKDPWVLIPGVGSIVLQALMWWYSATHLPNSTEQIFLHYTTVFGVDLVGAARQILYIPLFGLAMGLATIILSCGIYRLERLLSRLLLAAYFVVQTVLLVGLWFIIRLNI